MTSSLAILPPTRALESSNRVGTGDRGKLGHAFSGLYRYLDFAG